MTLRRRMRSLPLSQIRVTDPFWTRWQRTLIETTLPHEYAQIVETGRLENFRRAARQAQGGFEGLWFNDSDVYKYVEACAYALAVAKSKEGVDSKAVGQVRRHMDECIEAIEAAQMADGYLNTYFQLEHPELRWRNLNTMHEMYCGGHLIEAGVAVHEALGERRLLDVAIRFAEHVMSVFGPDARRGYCGHQEIELALLLLGRATGEHRYADFARWMIEQRGHAPSVFEAELEDPDSVKLAPEAARFLKSSGKYVGDYCQDHAPIREHTEVVGHAVRAMYFYIAAAELADGREDQGLEDALERVWTNLTSRRMYVTGGIGPSASNEGFTRDYDLPNLTAYAETCAAIGLVFWGHALLELTGNSDYGDVLERALYNGALSGISLSGDRFFYANPLESRGTHERVPWFRCACCPPNIARLLGNLGHYLAGVSDDTFYLHVPAGVSANATFNGVPVRIDVRSNYPWSGSIDVSIEPQRPVEFAFAVRIPGWTDNVTTDAPGIEEEAEYEEGYAVFRRTWRSGDRLTIEFEMEPTWVEADPRVRDDLGRVALTRGPLVYCAEQHDVGFAPQLFMADTGSLVEPEQSSDLEGVQVLPVEGAAEVELFGDSLYAPLGATEVREARARFIPYYAWNNRGTTNMQVWVRRL